MIRALVVVIGLSTAPVPQAPAETYAQYSLMFEKSAGQYFAGGTAAGQWAWTPLSTTESDISWGDPKAWPPTSNPSRPTPAASTTSSGPSPPPATRYRSNNPPSARATS
ncbi:hypothetical protein [Kribbella pratensis]|uniref:hypothetical protein n=1 Tax=Kribbella pratensis TaxID=2512112 RepID=UPI001EDCFACC|nr:hypothetical protein [Kribbella pratensis]